MTPHEYSVYHNSDNPQIFAEVRLALIVPLLGTEAQEGFGGLFLCAIFISVLHSVKIPWLIQLLIVRDRNNAGYIPPVAIQYPAKARSSKTIAVARRRPTLLD